MEMQKAPFDTKLLDRLMEQAGIDLLLATSKHNVQYLLGGYRFHFYEHADAIGQSRYLPVFLYPRGKAERAIYVGHKMEAAQQEVEPLWVPTALAVSSTSADAMRHSIPYLKENGRPSHIAVELAFLPADAMRVLQDAFPEAEIVDALPMLERLRAHKPKTRSPGCARPQTASSVQCWQSSPGTDRAAPSGSWLRPCGGKKRRGGWNSIIA